MKKPGGRNRQRKNGKPTNNIDGTKKHPQPTAATDVEPAPQSKDSSSIVVGVGASAGGLEAVTELLKALPKAPGMAFVLVTHLDPKHESAMAELLSRSVALQVRQVRDGMKVEPDCVYVIPPNRTMTIQDGVLRLAERTQESGPPMPIDTFFRSLATERGKNAIAVVLSGTASDGTLGVAAIKNEGGITFAQDAASAKYSGMPNSAIASGHIDFVLRPTEIARELVRIRQHPYVRIADGHKLEESSDADSQIQEVFRLLKRLRKVDFSDYKPGTIRRRILRRMALARLEHLSEYVRMLQQNPKEIEALHHDILINVTSFFRDPGAFEALKEVVYPSIVRGRQPSDTIRVWVPGCSTGEEAYSHAIALVEYISKTRADVSIQVFGTDLSEEAIRTARTGIYKETISADVSPVRLRRFFSRVDSGYQIAKSIRDICIFATQNVFNDPPFSRMDLISCRNVLIYLSSVLQKRVIPIFHYALKPTGFLMVGNAEGIVGAGAELFEPADNRHKIYSRKMAVSPVAFGVVPQHYEYQGATGATPVPSPTDAEPAKTPIELQREADRLLLSKYVPAAVVVNDRFDILQTRGRINRYLELPSGRATLNLLKMAKSGLLFELQNALEEARASSSAVSKQNVQFERNGGFASVNIEVIPFHTPLQNQQSFVVVLEDSSAEVKVEAAPAGPQDTKDRQIEQLKQELGATKQYLQSIIDALEASNEELQSANEEIQSGNEELQSTNEELQTSKEELESANEELNTVNEEMQHRNAELTLLNNDLLNLLASVNIPIVMLDAGLTIRRITPQVEEALGITPVDVGRQIAHTRLKIHVPNLERVMLDTIQGLQPRDLQVQDGQNHGYRLRITPYRTMDNRIDGVVLVFFEKQPAMFGVNKAQNRTQRNKSK